MGHYCKQKLQRLQIGDAKRRHSKIVQFCPRHNIVLEKSSGEAVNTSHNIARNQLESGWLHLCSRQSRDEIFIAGEAECCHIQLQNSKKKIVWEEKCWNTHLLVAANETDTAKIKLLVIGKFTQRKIFLQTVHFVHLCKHILVVFILW